MRFFEKRVYRLGLQLRDTRAAGGAVLTDLAPVEESDIGGSTEIDSERFENGPKLPTSGICHLLSSRRGTRTSVGAAPTDDRRGSAASRSTMAECDLAAMHAEMSENVELPTLLRELRQVVPRDVRGKRHGDPGHDFICPPDDKDANGESLGSPASYSIDRHGSSASSMESSPSSSQSECHQYSLHSRIGAASHSNRLHQRTGGQLMQAILQDGVQSNMAVVVKNRLKLAWLLRLLGLVLMFIGVASESEKRGGVILDSIFGGDPLGVFFIWLIEAWIMEFLTELACADLFIWFLTKLRQYNGFMENDEVLERFRFLLQQTERTQKIFAAGRGIRFSEKSEKRLRRTLASDWVGNTSAIDVKATIGASARGQ